MRVRVRHGSAGRRPGPGRPERRPAPRARRTASLSAARLALGLLLAGLPLARAQTAAERLVQATIKVFNPDSTATGFLLRDPAPEAARTNVILVTAAHALRKAKGDHVLLVCRVQDHDGAWSRHDHKVLIRRGTNELWTSHPAQDVAALRCALPPQARFEALPHEALADEAAARQRGLTVGSRLLIACYPYRTEANKAGFPLLREGLVSGYPLFPASAFPTVLFSAPTFAGDSGAPAALAAGDDAPPLVVGLVVTRTQQNDRLKSPEWDLTFKRDMDLGALLHAAFIRETLRLLP